MQQPNPILPDHLSAAPSLASSVHRDATAMNYLLAPVTNELIQRMAVVFDSDEEWYWFDFYPAPDEIKSGKLMSASFFDQSLQPDSVGSLDGIVVNLQISWLDFERVIFLCRQWLKPGGHLFFTSFGPDTLFELREAWGSIDGFSHVHDFPDLHTLGNQLTKNGFEKPILDTDWHGVEFEDIDLLMSDLRRQGFANQHRDRRRTLTAKSRIAALRSIFESQSPVQMTFEVIYGYARAPKPKSDGIHVREPALHAK